MKNISASNIAKRELIDYIDSISKSFVASKNHEEVLGDIDLVFSSGGFNAPIGVGIAMYLKQLEKYKHINVKRVSGSSIGAFISLWYIMDNPTVSSIEFIEREFIKVIQHFKKTKTLSIYNSFIRKYVYTIFDSDNMTPIQNRVFITYYDTKKCKKQIVSTYENREHLINCIIQSGYIPYITNRNRKYKNRYIDGIIPYIFPDKQTLYVDMVCHRYLFGCISINIPDIHKRMRIGVDDVNSFFTRDESLICCYINELTYARQLERKFIEILFFIILFIADVLYSIHSNTNMLFSDSIIYIIFYDILSRWVCFIDHCLWGFLV